MVESAVASNRIEGVTVDEQRVGTVVFGNGVVRDRDEEEIRGYRKALELIHGAGGQRPEVAVLHGQVARGHAPAAHQRRPSQHEATRIQARGNHGPPFLRHRALR